MRDSLRKPLVRITDLTSFDTVVVADARVHAGGLELVIVGVRLVELFRDTLEFLLGRLQVALLVGHSVGKVLALALLERLVLGSDKA